MAIRLESKTEVKIDAPNTLPISDFGRVLKDFETLIIFSECLEDTAANIASIDSLRLPQIKKLTYASPIQIILNQPLSEIAQLVIVATYAVDKVVKRISATQHQTEKTRELRIKNDRTEFIYELEKRAIAQELRLSRGWKKRVSPKVMKAITDLRDGYVIDDAEVIPFKSHRKENKVIKDTERKSARRIPTDGKKRKAAAAKKARPKAAKKAPSRKHVARRSPAKKR